ncbi:hypothetical protein I3842_07G198400 [Carya illinoinensis]|uniref:Uncharacterized protein n=1 Tax=Carya illinoinensis TaxID=32201 RepID=A0A922JES7_CARIL|nr:hypothetical protein I3842_07G198400 [Carya illinoinensis]
MEVYTCSLALNPHFYCPEFVQLFLLSRQERGREKLLCNGFSKRERRVSSLGFSSFDGYLMRYRDEL